MDTTNDTTPKKCSKCGETYPATTEYFPREKRNRSGLAARCKECEYARTMEWAKTHPENVSALNKRYYEGHRIEENERGKLWKRNNAARVEQKKSDYRALHRQEINAYAAQWVKDHPEQKRANNRLRRAKRYGVDGTHTLAEIRMLRATQSNCWWCGKPVGDEYHIDHRIPLSRGGSDAIDNLVISCPTCNMNKHDKLPQEWNGRLL